MQKIISFYPVPYYDREACAAISVELRTDKDGRESLSMQGSFGGTGGQCYGEILTAYNAVPRLKQYALLQRLCAVWERWHLNDMRAGTPRQMDALREARKKGFKGEYPEQLKYLDSCGLAVDDGYKYGSAWLYEKLPDDVLTFIKQLLGIPIDVTVSNKKHIAFTQQGGGYYLSSLKDTAGKPVYTIYKVQEGWAVRVLNNNTYIAWSPSVKANGWNAKTKCFSTLNNARTAVNL